MCSPCGPMVCYKYEDCGPPKGKSSNGGHRVEEDGGEKKNEKENQLKRTKSRELRGGIMYYSCHCIKRNGLQHDCRRTGCGGEPACLVLPDPLCAPSQLARARGLADPAVLAAHTHANVAGGSGGSANKSFGSGKKFIVCELKGILPDVSVDKSGKCCKCPAKQDSIKAQSGAKQHACICTGATVHSPLQMKAPPNTPVSSPCSFNCGFIQGSPGTQSTVITLDDKTLKEIVKTFEAKELAESAHGKNIAKSSDRPREATKTAKEEPCTRQGCIHWKPPPPCVWDLPCKADCFETPAGIQPGRNPLTGGGGFSCVMESSTSDRKVVAQGLQQPRQKFKLLTPECCTGCSAPSDGGGTAASGGPAPGLPLLVMKLC